MHCCAVYGMFCCRLGRVEHVLETWESLGVNNGPQLLSELGFTERGHERLSLRDLATALEEECRVGSERDGRGPAAVTALHLAALSYLHEVKFLRYLYSCLVDYFSPSSLNFWTMCQFIQTAIIQVRERDIFVSCS